MVSRERSLRHDLEAAEAAFRDAERALEEARTSLIKTRDAYSAEVCSHCPDKGNGFACVVQGHNLAGYYCY